MELGGNDDKESGESVGNRGGLSSMTCSHCDCESKTPMDDENPFSVQFPVMVSLNVLGALEVVLDGTPDGISLATLQIWLMRAWDEAPV